jgi:hypothetical protein
VDAVVQHPDEDLRYKDVIDFVSDAFADDLNQTPFFVVQADFTEHFCSVSPTLREAVQKALGINGSTAASTKSEQRPTPLVEKVKSRRLPQWSCWSNSLG